MAGNNGGGRPCLYKPEMAVKAKEWASQGIIKAEIAKGLGIGETTLYEWINTIPEFGEAFKKAEEYKVNAVVNALFKRAIGYDYNEITEENGEIKKTVKKHIPGDTTAQQVYLYNRDPQNWQAKHGESTQNINVNFQLPQLEQELQQIAEKRKALEMQLNQGVWELKQD